MKIRIVIVAGLTSIVLAACGGGTGDTVPVPGSGLVDAETGELKANAAGAIGGSFDGNLSAIGKMLNQNSDVLVGTLGDVVVGGTTEFPAEVETDAQVQNTLQSVVESSLATGETTDSSTTRSGNSISVDPDEDELCRDESLFGMSSLAEIADCKNLLRDLTVELLATSEEQGVMTYLYKNEPLMRIGYGVAGDTVEIELAGLRNFINEASIIRTGAEIDDLPSTMTGSLKFVAAATNSTPGQESGTISFDVVTPIRYITEDADGQTDISIDVGTIFSITADVTTGAGSLFFDAGAIAAIAPTDSGLGRVNFAGFTGSADINPTDGSLVVRNFGLSKGPFSASVNNKEVMRATLGAFGFQVTSGTDMQPGEVIIDGNMDLSFMLSQFNGFDLDIENVEALALRLMAPNTTTLSSAPNGATLIGGAGPFTISVGTTNAMGEENTALFTVNSGECFTDLVTDDGDLEVPSADICR